MQDIYDTYSEQVEPKKERFKKFKALPYSILKIIKKIFFCLTKRRGRGILIIIILFLYFTNSFGLIYYHVKIKIENYKINAIITRFERDKKDLIESKNKLDCYKEQTDRILNNKDYKIGFCNKN